MRKVLLRRDVRKMMGVFEAAAQESSHRQRQPARTRGDGRTFAEIAAERQVNLDK